MAATGYVGGDPTKVSRGGDTMTGALVLPGDPTSPLQAADKAYVDSVTSSGVADATTTSKGKIQLAGDLGGTAAAPTVPALTGKVGTARQVLSGTGLTGGGDLSADRTLAVSFGTGAGQAAQGNDSRITGAVQASITTTKGDLLVATAPATLARLGVGSDGQVLTADAASAGGMKWATTSGGGSSTGQDNVFPLSAYSLLAASGDPNEFQNQSGVSANTVFMARVWIPAGTAISKLCAAVRTGGTYATSSTPNQIALYDDTGARVAITADDNTLWATAGWAVRTITTILSQGTGRWAYIGYIVGGYTGVAMPFPMGANDSNAAWLGQNINNTGNRRAFYLVASSLPASFNPASAGTSTGYIPLVGAA